MKNNLCALVQIASAMLVAAFFSGCEFTPRKDVDGNGPVEVAREFVEFARTGNVAKAASFWREGDIKNIEANQDESFAEYCEYFRSETYRLEYEGSDKGIYWVRFFGTDAGKTRARILYVDPPENSKDGRWKLREDRWIKESNRDATPNESNTVGGRPNGAK